MSKIYKACGQGVRLMRSQSQRFVCRQTQDKATARRIAAALNACAGVRTTNLEHIRLSLDNGRASAIYQVEPDPRECCTEGLSTEDLIALQDLAEWFRKLKG